MTLNEILRFQSVVFDALVCKEIYRYCFLTQGITTILLVAENAEDAAATHVDRPFTVRMPLFVSKSAIWVEE